MTRVENDGDDYEKATYEHRGDRIYIRGDDVLISEDFRYFGSAPGSPHRRP